MSWQFLAAGMVGVLVVLWSTSFLTGLVVAVGLCGVVALLNREKFL
jgi:hypothetical protein